MQRCIAALLVVTMSACGLTMTTGPDPRRPPDQRPVCTESMNPPRNDGVGAVLGLLSILGGVLILKSESANHDIGGAMVVGGVVVTVASYASGAIGYSRVKKCRAAVSEFDRRAPPAGPPGSPGSR